ncbi:hypothetical protein L9F63_008293, partial [Diploptera punctata]
VLCTTCNLEYCKPVKAFKETILYAAVVVYVSRYRAKIHKVKVKINFHFLKLIRRFHVMSITQVISPSNPTKISPLVPGHHLPSSESAIIRHFGVRLDAHPLVVPQLMIHNRSRVLPPLSEQHGAT